MRSVDGKKQMVTRTEDEENKRKKAELKMAKQQELRETDNIDDQKQDNLVQDNLDTDQDKQPEDNIEQKEDQ